MATLSKPKCSDSSSYRNRNARWRYEKRLEPPDPKHHTYKGRDVCKSSPNGEHVFAEYLYSWSHTDSEGNKRTQYILSCVYCKAKPWNSGLDYDQMVKWVTKRVNA